MILHTNKLHTSGHENDFTARGYPEERYRRCLAYGRSMPGAVQLALAPGDCCFYRPVPPRGG